MELRVDDLLLRPPIAADVDPVTEACRDPEIARFIPLVPSPYTRADAEEWLRKAGDAWAESDERTFTIVDEGGAGRVQGVVTVRLRDGGSVGYWLAPWARGRGTMTKAVRAVVDWAGSEHGVTRLFLMTHPENVASQRVAERSGFVRAGTRHHQPPFADGITEAVLFELAVA